MLLLAYRRCDARDQALIRLLANAFAGGDGLHMADVLNFPREQSSK